MHNDSLSPLHKDNCALHELRQHAVFTKFVKCLRSQLDIYREEYEEQEASEFNRGKVQALKDLLNDLAQQNIR